MQRVTGRPFRQATHGLAAIILLVSVTFLPSTTHADTNDVYQLNCSTCVHLADFVNAAVTQATRWTDRTQGEADGLFSGMYLVSSTQASLTALVNVQETAYPASSHFTYWNVRTISGTAIKPDGTVMTSDADLDATDQALYAQFRRAKEIGPVHLPPDYGTSYINNAALDEDTSDGIDYVLYVEDRIPANTIEVGTVIEVTWQDGTTALWVRASATSEYQWVMVPGSAKNAQGQPIDPHGNVIGNPNGASPGLAGAPGFPTSPDYVIIVNPGRFCDVSVQVDYQGHAIYTGDSWYPCGG